ncbi:MAG TPA: transglycosylase family protein [Yinghuangia sp.]|uniref:transglycosylase family protein n=1 Tax=Yinghuangia sp. YIM S10712 TaxID=3436930 RepID=UPI002BF18C71|nr:transglycosylase family protein [Yinghuangia sp.]
MYRRTVRSSAYLIAGTVLAMVLGTAAAAPAHAVSDATWDRLAMCESSGRWSINTGNGYYGGLQILPSTWNEAGGRTYAALPHQATRRQQINIAERILRWQGWDAWPQCSRSLGLHAVPITTTYVVQDGDTLASIADLFDVAGGWETLYVINREVIGPDPDIVFSGTWLDIP